MKGPYEEPLEKPADEDVTVQKGVVKGFEPSSPSPPTTCTASDACHREPTLLIRYGIGDNEYPHLLRWVCEACRDAIAIGRDTNTSPRIKRRVRK